MQKKTKQSDLDLGRIVLESITQNMSLYAFNMCLGLLVETNELIKDFYLKVNNAGVYVQINSLRPPVCEILSFKCISAINLTYDLESQGHILFPLVDFVDLHNNSL